MNALKTKLKASVNSALTRTIKSKSKKTKKNPNNKADLKMLEDLTTFNKIDEEGSNDEEEQEEDANLTGVTGN